MTSALNQPRGLTTGALLVGLALTACAHAAPAAAPPPEGAMSAPTTSASRADAPTTPALTPVLGQASRAPGSSTADTAGPTLPTGVRLDPVGTVVEVGNFPLAMRLSPDGRYALLLLSGWRQQGLQIVDRATGQLTQTVELPSAFIGLAFAPDGRTLYVSGGGRDVVYRFDWHAGRATLRDSLDLDATIPGGRNSMRMARRYAAGLALSRDGSRLYVAENMDDSLAVVDLASGEVTKRYAAGHYPYDVAVGPDGTVYVSSWAGRSVLVYHPEASALRPADPIPVGRHPSTLLLGAGGTRLFVASASTDQVVVVDTHGGRPVTTLLDPPPAGPREGSTPNAMALSADGTRLYVAEADNNAVAVFDLTPAAAGIPGAKGNDLLVGRIPVDWYPTALAVQGDTLLVACGKGHGTGPNPGLEQPGQRRHSRASATSYTLGQIQGTLRTVPLAGLDADLAGYTRRVATANHWDEATTTPTYPPFQHVIYIIRENRTYDQVLGDIPQADGDSSLVFFPQAVTPNAHALAERFGIFDRFFVNAEVSADGHNWSTAAYATDYVEKTTASEYSGRGRPYDYEGTNRGKIALEDQDPAQPANGYLWDLAHRGGISFYNFGEFVVPPDADDSGPMPPGYRGDKPYLASHTDPDYPGFDLSISDQRRANVFIHVLQRYDSTGSMPALVLMRLPNDHTAGGTVGAPTPRAYVADNDLALGRIVDAVSHSRFWASTVFFVLEDDAQNGPDHVDSHRSVLLVISPYNRGGVIHRFVNTTDVLATIADILHLGHLSQFDYYGRPLRLIFGDTANLTPYSVLMPAVSLGETNAANNPGAKDSKKLDLRFEDSSNDDLFNRILWRMIKGPDVPYPGPTRAPVLEFERPR